MQACPSFPYNSTGMADDCMDMGSFVPRSHIHNNILREHKHIASVRNGWMDGWLAKWVDEGMDGWRD